MKNRQGSYKKLLLSPETLESRQSYLAQNLEAIKGLALSEEEFTTLYILLYLRLRSPQNWLQRIQPTGQVEEKKLLDLIPSSFELNDWEKGKLLNVSAQQIFSEFALKGIPQSVNRAMINWYKGLWKIKMLNYIPTSRELLSLQVLNTRCISLMTSPVNCAHLVLGSRDPLSFVLHDLMHADQFFSQNESLKGQLGFYWLINSIYDKEETKSLLKKDSVFKKEFEYVASDMNAYVIHLFKCLKSSIFRTDESYFQKLQEWWKMSDTEKISSQKLNTPDFDHQDEMVLKDFFEKHQEIFA